MHLNDKHLLRCVQKTGMQQVSFDIPSEPSSSAPCVSVRFAFMPRACGRGLPRRSLASGTFVRGPALVFGLCWLVCTRVESQGWPPASSFSSRERRISGIFRVRPLLRTYFRPAARPPFPEHETPHENAIYQRSDAKRLSSPIFRSTLSSMVAFPDRDSRLNAKILFGDALSKVD